MKERRKLIDKENKQLSVREQVKVLQINRSSLYYKSNKKEDDMDYKIRKEIDRQHLDTPFYGSRKMTAHLRRKGFCINRKKVQRLMKIMGISVIYPKPNLSKRKEGHKIYPYLLKALNIQRPNYVWSCDITYLPRPKGHLYMVAIIDWYSKEILSWRISNTLDNKFCIEALKEALKSGTPEIFNTDQGSQFTSNEFTKILTDSDIRISMDSKGRALDNVVIERFWRSLKYEKLYLYEYLTTKELINGIKEYIDFYNNDRPHETLKYSTPHEIHYNIAA